MDVSINKQEKIWNQMSNFVGGWKKENLYSKSFNHYETQPGECKSNSFIVDWQLNDSSPNAVQLSLSFKEY